MPTLPEFASPYAADDGAIVATLLAGAAAEAAAEARIDARASRLITAIRDNAGSIGGIEDFLREYSLSTKEGLALMILAEALLRVPDSETADALIEDKLGQGDWAHRETKSEALLVSASAWALGITARIIQPGETPEGIVASLAKRLGLPAVRTATRQAMRVLGSHFVLGQTIGEALKRASQGGKRGLSLFLRHAGRRRPHRRGRQALLQVLQRRHRRHRPRGRQRSRSPPGPASRSSSRRCIRATRR